MKAHRLLAILSALVFTASWQCFALTPIRDVSKAEAAKPAAEEDQGYETPAKIKAMSPRKATVLEHNGCYSMFSAADGKEFSIGSPAAGSQVVEFLNTLKKGTTCELPRAFLDFEKASPAFDTAEKIKAMPPCKATVEHVGVRDSRLRTAEGKLFFIGGDEATPEVIQFLEALRDKHTCQFPDVFLEFVKTAGAATPLYATVAQVKAIPACKAIVEHVETFQSVLRTADGKRFRIGSETGEQEVWHFVGVVLKVGQTYELPRVFLDFDERKHYSTAQEIAKMPAVKAALECSAPCYSLFKTTEGKHFAIGNPGSKADVIHFLRSLEDGKTYQFPDVFLEYQKGKR